MAATVIQTPAAGDVVLSSWGAQVAAALNGIQSGVAVSGSITAGNGAIAVVFPRPYASPPVVVATTGAASYFFANVDPPTTTGFTIRLKDVRDAQAGTGNGIPVQWIAVGVPA